MGTSFVQRLLERIQIPGEPQTMYAAQGQTAPHLLNLQPDYPIRGNPTQFYPDPSLLPDPYLYGAPSAGYGVLQVWVPDTVFNSAVMSSAQSAYYDLTASKDDYSRVLNYEAPAPQYLLPKIAGDM